MIASSRQDAGIATTGAAHRILQRTLDGKESQISMRSDYAAILPKLKAAIAAQGLMLMSFEDCMSVAGYARICRFLGLSEVAPDLTPVSIGDSIQMQPDASAAALDWLRPQYEAAEEHFGTLPETWNSP